MSAVAAARHAGFDRLQLIPGEKWLTMVVGRRSRGPAGEHSQGITDRTHRGRWGARWKLRPQDTHRTDRSRCLHSKSVSKFGNSRELRSCGRADVQRPGSFHREVPDAAGPTGVQAGRPRFVLEVFGSSHPPHTGRMRGKVDLSTSSLLLGGNSCSSRPGRRRRCRQADVFVCVDVRICGRAVVFPASKPARMLTF